MLQVFRNKNFYVVFFIDAILVLLALYSAYLIRFEFQIPSDLFNRMLNILPLILLVKLLTFFFLHLYQGMWRYTSLVDILNVIKATFFSSTLIMVGILLLHQFKGYPRSVFLIDWGITLIFIGGFRLGIRLKFAGHVGMKLFPSFRGGAQKGKRLLVIGAGDTGEKVVREMLVHFNGALYPIGLLDDDEGKLGRTIHGISVLGKMDEILSFKDLFDEILIAIPSASAAKMRRIVSFCEKTEKPFRTVPALSELIDGKVSMKAVRHVTLQDLFGREEVKLSTEEISRYLFQKRVMITGAGGSIGSELVRQVCRFFPLHLMLVDMGEYNLFQIEQECQRRFPLIETSARLLDIRDLHSVERLFREFKPQVVFHAAAYKHVPLQELNPWEAVKNNVLGTKHLVGAAHTAEVERFVFVSTDKAVRPTNVMGATKRVAEMLISCVNGTTSSRFMVVRFGNVMGSSGSVIPTFQAQIERGGPVTVTHPEITRYFMSIPEASQLILEAVTMGTGGEIFLLDMGEPVKIVDLAQDLIRLHGYEPERDIAIEFVGLRPGEKLYEELITEGEGIVETEHEKIMVLRSECHPSARLSSQIEELIAAAHTHDPKLIKCKLQELVPEYTPDF